MCIGIPMRVVKVGDYHAVCDDGTRLRRIDTSLIDTPTPGDWLLVFLDAAREILDAASAQTILDAVTAISKIMGGETSVEHLFDDLIDREPQLPAHLTPNEET